MKTSVFMLSFLLLLTRNVIGQGDSNKVFERTKGTWEYPVKKCYKEIHSSNNILDGDFPDKHCTFYTDSICSVTAVFDGVITRIFDEDSITTVIIKYGKYFILYNGLSQTILKKGDKIKIGDKLGRPTKDIDGNYEIEMALFSTKGLIDPFPWFSKKNILTK